MKDVPTFVIMYSAERSAFVRPMCGESPKYGIGDIQSTRLEFIGFLGSLAAFNPRQYELDTMSRCVAAAKICQYAFT